jgi:hypothetical protein
MKSIAKLVYQTYITYLPTAFPAYYYGMPNGKIYLVFSRFYNAAIGKSGLEFVFAEHNDYSFDYEKETILARNDNSGTTPVFAECIDNPNSKFNIVSISRKLRSYSEAQHFVNRRAKKMKKAV